MTPTPSPSAGAPDVCCPCSLPDARSSLLATARGWLARDTPSFVRGEVDLWIIPKQRTESPDVGSSSTLVDLPAASVGSSPKIKSVPKDSPVKVFRTDYSDYKSKITRTGSSLAAVAPRQHYATLAQSAGLWSGQAERYGLDLCAATVPLGPAGHEKFYEYCLATVHQPRLRRSGRWWLQDLAKFLQVPVKVVFEPIYLSTSSGSATTTQAPISASSGPDASSPSGATSTGMSTSDAGATAADQNSAASGAAPATAITLPPSSRYGKGVWHEAQAKYVIGGRQCESSICFNAEATAYGVELLDWVAYAQGRVDGGPISGPPSFTAHAAISRHLVLFNLEEPIGFLSHCYYTGPTPIISTKFTQSRANTIVPHSFYRRMPQGLISNPTFEALVDREPCDCRKVRLGDAAFIETCFAGDLWLRLRPNTPLTADNMPHLSLGTQTEVQFNTSEPRLRVAVWVMHRLEIPHLLEESETVVESSSLEDFTLRSAKDVGLSTVDSATAPTTIQSSKWRDLRRWLYPGRPRVLRCITAVVYGEWFKAHAATAALHWEELSGRKETLL